MNCEMSHEVGGGVMFPCANQATCQWQHRRVCSACRDELQSVWAADEHYVQVRLPARYHMADTLFGHVHLHRQLAVSIAA